MHALAVKYRERRKHLVDLSQGLAQGHPRTPGHSSAGQGTDLQAPEQGPQEHPTGPRQHGGDM
eukprot:6227907-Pyramimonas_sp.AAC.1